MSTTELEEIIEDLASDPVMFVETMLNVKPEKWQKEFLYNVQNNPRNAVKSGHGVGKTAVLSWLILWWLLTRHPCKVICTANTAHQLSDVLWAEVKKWGRQLPEAFYNQLEMPIEKAYDYTSKVMTKNMQAKDAKEGIEAFIKKRTPKWSI